MLLDRRRSVSITGDGAKRLTCSPWPVDHSLTHTHRNHPIVEDNCTGQIPDQILEAALLQACIARAAFLLCLQLQRSQECTLHAGHIQPSVKAWRLQHGRIQPQRAGLGARDRDIRAGSECRDAALAPLQRRVGGTAAEGGSGGVVMGYIRYRARIKAKWGVEGGREKWRKMEGGKRCLGLDPEGGSKGGMMRGGLRREWSEI